MATQLLRQVNSNEVTQEALTPLTPNSLENRNKEANDTQVTSSLRESQSTVQRAFLKAYFRGGTKL